MKKALLVITGVLMFLGGVAHWWIGLPALRAELAAAHAPEKLWAGATAVWTFTSGAMLTFAVMVITAGLRAGKRNGADALVRWIALFYVIFGVCAFVAIHRDAHFLAFIVLGLLAGIATFLPSQPKSANA